MTRKVRLTDEAIRQIETISDYIAKESPLNAKRWLSQLQKRVDSLGNSAEGHAILYSADVAGKEVRQTFHGTYRILYRIEDDVVHVVTVRHGARESLGPKEMGEE